MSQTLDLDANIYYGPQYNPSLSLKEHRGYVVLIENTLEKAKENSFNTKAVAFLKTALTVSLFVGGVLASVLFEQFNTPLLQVLSLTAGTVAMLTGGLILPIHFGCQAAQRINNIERRLSLSSPPDMSDNRQESDLSLSTFLSPVSGFFMPLYEAFTRESRLARLLENERQALYERTLR